MFKNMAFKSFSTFEFTGTSLLKRLAAALRVFILGIVKSSLFGSFRRNNHNHVSAF